MSRVHERRVQLMIDQEDPAMPGQFRTDAPRLGWRPGDWPEALLVTLPVSGRQVTMKRASALSGESIRYSTPDKYHQLIVFKEKPPC